MFHCKYVHVCVLHLCPTLSDPMDPSPPGSSVNGIILERILEWVAISFSRGSSPSRDQTYVSGEPSHLHDVLLLSHWPWASLHRQLQGFSATEHQEATLTDCECKKDRDWVCFVKGCIVGTYAVPGIYWAFNQYLWTE